MTRGNCVKLLAGLAILLLAVNASAAEIVTYARGSDYEISIDGGTYYSASFYVPTASSTTTDLTTNVSSGTHEIGRWYTFILAENQIISGTTWSWISSISSSNASAKLKMLLYDFDPLSGSSTLIMESDLVEMSVAASALLMQGDIDSPYSISAGHRLKGVLEYTAASSGGQISLKVDEYLSGHALSFNDPKGNTYLINDLKGTIITSSDICGSPACTSNSDCDDGESGTIDICHEPNSCTAYCSNESAVITCNSNAECNDNNPLTTDTCTSPGTIESRCVNSSCPVACGSDLDCDDGNPVTADICYNEGSCLAACSNSGECIIGCGSDADCDDGNPLTTETCQGPGDCGSFCSYNVCEIACHSNSDCDDGNPLTSNSCQSAGQCNSSCVSTVCSTICTENADCDDGDLGTADVCVGAGKCNAICWNSTTCGNGICDEDETQCNCPGDCGSCTGTTAGVCTGYGCDRHSCRILKTLGCCGNDVCELGEDYSNCATDCKPRSVKITAIDSPTGSPLIIAEEVTVKVSVEADGLKINNAKVTAKGFFGELVLFNDGQHGDGISNDNVYANTFTILEGVKEGSHPVTIEAEFAGRTGLLVETYLVSPRLNITLATDKEKYNVGDVIRAYGFLKKKETPFENLIDANILVEGRALYKKQISSSGEGKYEFEYHSSFLDRSGSWIITVHSIDQNGNVGLVTKTIEFSSPDITSFLEVELEDLNKTTYRRGESVELVARVRNKEGGLITDASVSTIGLRGEKIDFREIEDGKYLGTIPIGFDSEIGTHLFKVIALKVDGATTHGGGTETSIEVTAIEILYKLLEPSTTHYQIGEELLIKIRLTYPNDEPVTKSTIDANVNGNPVGFRSVENGVYAGTYLIRESDSGAMILEFLAIDEYGNRSQAGSLELEVSGISIWHYVREFSLTVLILAFLGVVVAFVAFTYLNYFRKIFFMKKRGGEIIALIKDAQTQYFKDATMDKRNYDSLIMDYMTELEDLKKSLTFLNRHKPFNIDIKFKFLESELK
ncbi:MAG: hypothetical protein ABID38_04300 [Candidatus Diapherotrites archaeon]